ncbi:hypothetical protein PanNE5_28870 [Pandoraea sp. NE5]|uniref:hypothetical protein n=1 Tax=Pandoraea sp. NE5 TaxID=2904129 RepID=UPI0021C477A2|nr:hypothetical protein [Pandoraea sp. NE5]BDD93447.1 hypothetical protein PanNE5_28870 [Pandoraea sp. NE5]
MRTDPIQPNFYRGTGGYAWQLAEYLQGGHGDENGSYTLCKSIPPQLHNPLAACPEFLQPHHLVRWSRSVRIAHDTPRLVGTRGVRSSLVVVESAQAFGGFRHADVQALVGGTTVGALSGMEVNGVVHEAATLLVALYRHGFIELDEAFPASPAVRYMIEPTCRFADAPGIGRVVINQLNGRTIRLSEASQRIFSLDEQWKAIPESVPLNIANFVEAGMLRLLSGGSAYAHD